MAKLLPSHNNKNAINTATLTPTQKARIPHACDTCEGCGKVCDRDGKPWSRFQKARNPEVAAGLIQPVVCPACGGIGIGTPEELQAAYEEQQAKQGEAVPAEPAPAPTKATPPTAKRK